MELSITKLVFLFNILQVFYKKYKTSESSTYFQDPIYLTFIFVLHFLILLSRIITAFFPFKKMMTHKQNM